MITKLPKTSPMLPAYFLIAILLVAGVYLIGGKQSTLTGTIISLSSIDYTNYLPAAQFTKAFKAQVEIGRGGQYLTGVRSNSIQGVSQDGATKSKDNFDVKFQLNELACRYPVSLQSNVIRVLSIENKQPQNQILTSGWSYACSLDVQSRITNLLGGGSLTNVYVQKQIGTDQMTGAPVYCNAVPSSCLNDFKANCPSGYNTISCTLPQTQVDAVWNAFSGGSRTGYTCIKVKDSPDTIDWSVFSVSPPNPYASATLTVTDTTKNQPAVPIVLANGGAEGRSSDGNDKVYAEMQTVKQSFNSQCPSEANLVVSKQNAISPNYNIINSFSYNTKRARYETLKGSSYLTSGSSVENVLSDIISFNNDLSLVMGTPYNPNLQYSASNGQILYDMKNNPPFFPVIDLWVNADWVGVVVPLAIPSLGTVQPISFASGTTGQGSIIVSNTVANSGAIAVDLPTCTPSTPTFAWINNPNRNYNAFESYTSSFSVTGNEGVYSCTIKARSGGPSQTGNLNEITSAPFIVSIGRQCTQPSPPFILSPTPSEPCRVICPLDAQICTQSGLDFDAVLCKCKAKPDCTQTGTCPPEICTDGTAIGICNPSGMRCVLQNNQAVLVTDAQCKGSENVTQCLPLIQYKVGNECQTDYVTFMTTVIVILGIAYFATREKRKR